MKNLPAGSAGGQVAGLKPVHNPRLITYSLGKKPIRRVCSLLCP